MSKHSEALEAYLKIVKYSERKCKICVFNLSKDKENEFCVFEGCPGVVTSNALIKDIQKRVEKLERQESKE